LAILSSSVLHVLPLVILQVQLEIFKTFDVRVHWYTFLQNFVNYYQIYS